MLSSFAKLCQYVIYGAAVLGGFGLLTAAYGSETEHEFVRGVGMSLFWSGLAFFLLAKGSSILSLIYLVRHGRDFRAIKEQRLSMSCWILGGTAMVFYGFLVLCLAWERYFLHK
jgi:hypothetical protein